MNFEYIQLTPEEYWKKEPQRVTAWYAYAEHLTSIGDIQKAEYIYKEAMASNVLDRKVRLAASYAKFAVEHLDFEKCELVFKKAFKIKKSVEITDSYINFLIKHEKYDDAEKILIELNESEPVNRTLFTLAELYEKKEQYTKAIPIYEKLIEKNSSNGKAWSRLRNAEINSKANTNENKITKSISFKPEHHSAGLAILQNFGTLLNKKYPEGDVAFSIEQQGVKITMIIEHPEGDKEVVEDYLNRYGLVVTGQLTPEKFLADPLAIMELKRQIIHMEGELKWEVEKQNMLKGIIVDQDKQITFFQNEMKGVLLANQSQLTNSNDLINQFLKLTETKDKNINDLLIQLVDSAKARDMVQANSISGKLTDSSPTVSDKVNEFIITTMASASGNAPAWIDFLSKVLP